jgi:hypothetical protein
VTDTPRTRRVDQLAPGDFIPFWGDDLRVISARPLENDLYVEVAVERRGVERRIAFPPGIRVEVVNEVDRLPAVASTEESEDRG